MTNLVTKSTFLNAIICPRLGWMAHHDKLPVSDSLDIKLRLLEGNAINERARKLYPSGMMVSGKMQDAISETDNAVKINNCMFEAAFSADGFGARADIIIKEHDGWHLMEVKSGADVKDEYIDDAAYTTMVLERAGQTISTVSLLLISKDYRKGMPDKALFVEEVVTNDVQEQVKEFNAIADQLRILLESAEPASPKLIFGCKGCDIFETCTGEGISNHIFELPRISQKLFNELSGQDIVQIDPIPPAVKLIEAQVKVWKAVGTQQVIVSPVLKKELEAINWPAWYLDFETCMTALPLYDDSGSYERIVTQYSIHQYPAPGAAMEHFEYLAEQSHDCQRQITENLINILKGNGSIIVYSSFEKAIIAGLAEKFPDLSEPLHAIIGRLVDFCMLMRNNYYHPGFHGSYSIKNVLPVMVPELDYSDGDQRRRQCFCK